jgi:hypothetical protein
MTPINQLMLQLAEYPRNQMAVRGFANQLGIGHREARRINSEVRGKQLLRAERKAVKYAYRTTPISETFAVDQIRDNAEICGYRESTHGSSRSVKLGRETYYQVSTRERWPSQLGLRASYSKRPVSTSHTEVTVCPADYLAIPPRLRVVDRLLTLTATLDRERTRGDAPYLRGRGGDWDPVYRARWVRQSRGFSVTIESGWILWRDGRWTHTTSDPLTARRRAERPRKTAFTRDQWVSLEEALKIDPKVTWTHARKAGNCPTGCADWVNRHREGSQKPIKASLLWALAQRANDRLELVANAIRYAATAQQRKAGET